MAKIPVGRTIAHAYDFALSRFLTLLRITWLPLVIMLLPVVLLSGFYIDMLQPAVTGGLPSFGSIALLWLVFVPAVALGMSMLITGLTREVIAPGSVSGFYFFSLGRPVWRVLWGLLARTLLVILLLVVLLFVGILGGVALSTGIGLQPPSETGGPTVAVLLILTALQALVWGTLVYVWVRLFFFTAPVAVAEDRIGVRRGWKLARGNFWRSVIVLLAVALPWVVLYFVATFFFFGSDMFPPAASDGPARVAEWQARYAARMSEFFSMWYITQPVLMLISMFLYGLPTVATAFAYRAVTAHEPGAGAAQVAEVF